MKLETQALKNELETFWKEYKQKMLRFGVDKKKMDATEEIITDFISVFTIEKDKR